MLQNIQQFYGKKLGAVDGHVGHVRDFYFDDQTWKIRYLVADTGPWLAGRKVLLPSHAFAPHAFEGSEAADNDLLHVNLTRNQIEKSPSIDMQRPISRQYEEAYHRHFGWPFYWVAGGGDDYLSSESFTQDMLPRPGDDPDLRSMQAVTGYAVKAADGIIGSVNGFMINGRDWTIRELIVTASPEFGRDEIFLLPETVGRIGYEEATVYLKVTQDAIRQMVGGKVAAT